MARFDFVLYPDEVAGILAPAVENITTSKEEEKNMKSRNETVTDIYLAWTQGADPDYYRDRAECIAWMKEIIESDSRTDEELRAEEEEEYFCLRNLSEKQLRDLAEELCARYEEETTWYAVIKDPDDYPDWDTGSHDRKKAVQMALEYRQNGYPDAYIAVIDESCTSDPVCVNVIKDFD